MKKIGSYIAMFFSGAFFAMLIAYLTKRTLVIKKNENNQINVKKSKIKGNNSSIDNIPIISKKESNKTKKEDNKGIFKKWREKRNLKKQQKKLK